MRLRRTAVDKQRVQGGLRGLSFHRQPGLEGRSPLNRIREQPESGTC